MSLLFTPQKAKQLENIQRQALQLYPSAPRQLPPLPRREHATDPSVPSIRPGKGMTAWTSRGLPASDRPDPGMTAAALEEMQQLRWQVEQEMALMARMISQIQEENLMLRVQLAEEREHRFSTPEEDRKPAAGDEGKIPRAQMHNGASMMVEEVEEQPVQHDAGPENAEDTSRKKTSQERSMEVMLKIMQCNSRP